MDIPKKIESELVELAKYNPVMLMKYMLLILGRECVKANADHLNMSMDADIEGSRYKLLSKTRIIKIK